MTIAKRCAATGKRVQCEMGGRNAIVVLADADLEAAVAAIVSAGFGASGQRCTSSSRVIVERWVAPRLTELLLAAVRALPVGPGLDPRSKVGPLVSADALEDVLAALGRAVSEGTEILYGGSGSMVRSTRTGISSNQRSPSTLRVAGSPGTRSSVRL